MWPLGLKHIIYETLIFQNWQSIDIVFIPNTDTSICLEHIQGISSILFIFKFIDLYVWDKALIWLNYKIGYEIDIFCSNS